MKTNNTLLNITKIIALLLMIKVNTMAGKITPADYERVEQLGKVFSNKVLNENINIHWLVDNKRLWYRRDITPAGAEFIIVDAEAGTREKAFDHKQMAQAFSKACGEEVSPEKLPIDFLEYSEDGTQLKFVSFAKRWQCDLTKYEIEQLPDDANIPSSVRRLPRPLPSRWTGGETSIIFINKTKENVKLFWIDSSDKRRPYGEIEAGGQFKQNTYQGHVWLVTDCNDSTLAVFMAGPVEDYAIIDGSPYKETGNRFWGRRGRGRQETGKSPDGKWLAFIKDYNLFLKNLQNSEETTISNDGDVNNFYADDFHWSDDSKKLVAFKTKKGDGRKVYIIESSPDDQLQPKLQDYSYDKPGDNIDIEKPVLYDLASRKLIPISDELFPNPFGIWDIHWSPDSNEFTFLYNQRGHQVLRIVGVDAETAKTRTVVDERSDTFIDYSGKYFSSFINKTGELIWMSERDGWNHLYLYDTKTSQVKNQITKGDRVVRRVEHIDEEKRQIWFYAGGVYPEQDPYYQHLCRVNFDGSGFITLTKGDGTHSVTFSPDRKFFVDKWSRVDLPPVTELRNSKTGELICDLERADASELLKTGWRPPVCFAAKGRDSQTDIYGIIIQPINFDPNNKYPVIESIYAGPQGAFVPKAFDLQTSQRSFAELGFIIVQIDGMGTSYRSKAFQDVCWKNLGDAGFADRILWLKAASKKYPFMDIERVGIYGTSAGGQSALRALLAHGDFYKAGISDCGCHDNRMDKIWWNEQWMGWPVGEHYAEQSNVTQAHKLKGKLLLAVGELDRNVDPASTMQVVNALVKAQKDFELLVMPGYGHGVSGDPYVRRRMMDFFVRHLLGEQPPDWNSLN
ncbi:MAG: DPP IV N-terminal domain-containing protein [Sedimentisphaerales bacterium]|nr:DPP IV N-terminal domain-containing protein [Sedimentisphaerales bacterium]